jgi:hypothetical protein
MGNCRIVGVWFKRNYFAIGLNSSRKHQCDYTLMRAEIKDSRPGPKTVLFQKDYFLQLRPIAIIPTLR